jgi:hypothetical protein
MLFMTSKKTVDRGQAQSATITSKRQTAVNTLIDTFMKQLRQGGDYYRSYQWNKQPILLQIAVE